MWESMFIQRGLCKHKPIDILLYYGLLTVVSAHWRTYLIWAQFVYFNITEIILGHFFLYEKTNKKHTQQAKHNNVCMCTTILLHLHINGHLRQNPWDCWYIMACKHVVVYCNICLHFLITAIGAELYVHVLTHPLTAAMSPLPKPMQLFTVTIRYMMKHFKKHGIPLTTHTHTHKSAAFKRAYLHACWRYFHSIRHCTSSLPTKLTPLKKLETLSMRWLHQCVIFQNFQHRCL